MQWEPTDLAGKTFTRNLIEILKELRNEVLERRSPAKRKVKEENYEILNSDHNRDGWQDRHAPAFCGV